MSLDQAADILDVFGSDFLAYVLNHEGEVTAGRLLEDVLPEQVETVKIVARLREPYRPETGTPDGAIWASRLNADQYITQAQSSLANALRVQSGGTIPSPRTDSDPVLAALFRILADVYPALFLPERPLGSGAAISRTAFNHPARVDLEAAVLADSVLAKLYNDNNAAGGRSGFVYRSTGQGSGVQLIGFAIQQIGLAHSWARLDFIKPSMDEVADKLARSITIIRQALLGKPVTVPMWVGLTGVLLPEALDQLDLGWATLRQATDADRRIAESTGAAGKLTTTLPDGTVVTIDYSGDVVLAMEVPYKIKLGRENLEAGWPPALEGVQRAAADDIESLRLALALALEDEQPALIVQSWQLTVDPLGHGTFPGWNDTRRTPNLLPRQLTGDQVDAWITWSQRVKAHRTPSTGVAVRRMLQALGERRYPDDVLVDAVVVWENLFGASQETTMRICTALAWLLGIDAFDRAKRLRQYKDIYSLRSKIVHGSPKVAMDKVAQTSREAAQISLSALRELFENRTDLLAEKTSEDRGNKLLLDIRPEG